MIYSVLILLVSTSLVNCLTIKNIATCSTTVKEVRVATCTAEPCNFRRGSTATIAADFEAPNDSNKLSATLTALIGGFEVPSPDFDSNACNSHGIACPIKKGNKYTYNYDMYVLPEYPKINTTFKLDIKDDKGSDVLCFTMPVSIVD